MSEPLVTTVYAKNEYSASAVTTHSAFMISPGEQILRKIDIPAGGWRTIRISAKHALYRNPLPNANVGSCKFVFGLCSEGRGAGNVGNEHFAGIYRGHDSYTATTWVVNSISSTPPYNSSGSCRSDWTTPAGAAWVMNYYVERGLAVTTGSWDQGNGGSGVPFPIHNTEWNSSPSSSAGKDISGLYGYAWTPITLELTRVDNGNGTYNINVTSYRDLSGVVSLTGLGLNSYYNGINIPRAVYRMSMQGDPQQPLYKVAYNWNFWEKNVSGNDTFFGNTIEYNSGQVGPINEDLYGPLEYINCYWTSADSALKILIRDVQVSIVAAAGTEPPSPLALSVDASSPSSSVLTWS